MGKLDVITKKVDVLPMVKYYMDQLGIYDLFATYVRNPMRSPVDSAQIHSIMVANIVCASRPLYKYETNQDRTEPFLINMGSFSC